jgi:hypothetical protein
MYFRFEFKGLEIKLNLSTPLFSFCNDKCFNYFLRNFCKIRFYYQFVENRKNILCIIVFLKINKGISFFFPIGLEGW